MKAAPAPLPAVNVTAHVDHERLSCVRVGLSAHLDPPADLAARVAALSVETLRSELLAKARAHGNVQKWQTLRRQIADCEKKVRAAEEALRQVEAARTLLENDLPENLANLLREKEAELAAAVAARDAALRDLDTVKHLIPKSFVPAANSAASAVSTTMFLMGFREPVRAAEADLAAACECFRVILEKAIADHLAPAATALLALKKAERGSWDRHKAFEDSLRAEAVGPVPEGVVLNGYFFEVAPPPAPPEAPKPADAPARNPFVARMGGS